MGLFSLWIVLFEAPDDPVNATHPNARLSVQLGISYVMFDSFFMLFPNKDQQILAGKNKNIYRPEKMFFPRFFQMAYTIVVG